MHVVNDQNHLRYALHDSEKSRKLQRKLYIAAKRDVKRKFHALYDRIYRPDILYRAWTEVKSNKGSEGVDDQSFEDIEKLGVENFLNGIETDLKAGCYQAKPVLRVKIPKPDGGERPLGIPTIRDRVVQQACRIVIEPIFEATFLPDSYGFRPRKSAAQAIRTVKDKLYLNWWVVDADIKGYFDSIDQKILLNLVRRRISDKRVVKLIRKWLEAGVLVDGEYQRTTTGTPQGGVISPLLANIYLHSLDRFWQENHAHLGTLVRYADDFVIVCREESAAHRAHLAVAKFLSRLKLELHPEKTRVVRMESSGFDFLGFRFQKFKSRIHGKMLPYIWPRMKAMNAVRSRIRELTERRKHQYGAATVIAKLNPVIRGWRNYFRIGQSTLKFQQLDRYVRFRLLRYERNAHGNRYKLSRADFMKWYWTVSGVERFYIPGNCVA